MSWLPPACCRLIGGEDPPEPIAQESREINILLPHEARTGNRRGSQEIQRAALPRAIVFDPQLLLMDEPLGALDRRLREQLKLEIKRIQRELRMTVLFVTHDQDEALVMSDRVVVMRDGRIDQVATPQELYFRPANRFIADFVGEANILPCVVRNGVARHGAIVLPCDGADKADGDYWLMIRPEHVSVSEETGACVLDAPIQSVDFLGEAVRYTLSIDGQRFVVKTSYRRGQEKAPGQRLRCAWDPADAVLLSG